MTIKTSSILSHEPKEEAASRWYTDGLETRTHEYFTVSCGQSAYHFYLWFLLPQGKSK